MDAKPVVVLGVTGSIAAHKAVEVASQLTKRGCAVRVAMTPDAQRFVTPLPFQTLSQHPVVTDLFDERDDWKPKHIAWADEANLLLVAPASANTIAKLAHGLADNALTCIALALNPSTPVLIAPAMNGKMWRHPRHGAERGLAARAGRPVHRPRGGELGVRVRGEWGGSGPSSRSSSRH